eukprot:scaffold28182_cov50-Phaeocystis_antarctica.AAC.1
MPDADRSTLRLILVLSARGASSPSTRPTMALTVGHSKRSVVGSGLALSCHNRRTSSVAASESTPASMRGTSAPMPGWSLTSSTRASTTFSTCARCSACGSCASARPSSELASAPPPSATAFSGAVLSAALSGEPPGGGGLDTATVRHCNSSTLQQFDTATVRHCCNNNSTLQQFGFGSGAVVRVRLTDGEAHRRNVVGARAAPVARAGVGPAERGVHAARVLVERDDPAWLALGARARVRVRMRTAQRRRHVLVKGRRTHAGAAHERELQADGVRVRARIRVGVGFGVEVSRTCRQTAAAPTALRQPLSESR